MEPEYLRAPISKSEPPSAKDGPIMKKKPKPTADEKAQVEDYLREYEKHFMEDVLPNMRDSRCVVTALSDSIDFKLIVETGAMVLLDKPLILVTKPGVLVPPRLRKIANAVIVTENISEDPVAQAEFDRVMKWTMEILEKKQ